MVSDDKDNPISEEKLELILHDVRDNSPSPSFDPYNNKIKKISLRAGMDKCFLCSNISLWISLGPTRT